MDLGYIKFSFGRRQDSETSLKASACIWKSLIEFPDIPWIPGIYRIIIRISDIPRITGILRMSKIPRILDSLRISDIPRILDILRISDNPRTRGILGILTFQEFLTMTKTLMNIIPVEWHLSGLWTNPQILNRGSVHKKTSCALP